MKFKATKVYYCKIRLWQLGKTLFFLAYLSTKNKYSKVAYYLIISMPITLFEWLHFYVENTFIVQFRLFPRFYKITNAIVLAIHPESKLSC